MKTGSKELVILSYAIVCFHPSVSLNNEKNCCAISEDKIATCEKTAGLGSGNFSDLNSACRKVLVPVKIFQFQDMLNESVRYRDRAGRLYTGRGNGLQNDDRCVMQKELVTNLSLLL